MIIHLIALDVSITACTDIISFFFLITNLYGCLTCKNPINQYLPSDRKSPRGPHFIIVLIASLSSCVQRTVMFFDKPINYIWFFFGEKSLLFMDEIIRSRFFTWSFRSWGWFYRPMISTVYVVYVHISAPRG